MGRPYAEEMGRLADTYEWAAGGDISGLARFVGRAARRPMYAVGSGGSLTVATLAAVLHRHSGFPAAALTPMELVHGGGAGGGASVLVATAGGNNGDIAAAFEAATAQSGRNVCVLSACGGGRVGRLASAHRSVLACISSVPGGRDGFLAANSVLASCAWLARAYGDAHGWQGGAALPSAYGRLGAAAPDLRGIAACGRLAVLHDVWGKAAAADIESKMSESGMAAVQTADYRNFAHGRHHGLAGGASRSGVVALASPRSRDLVDRTLSQLPRGIPVCRVDTDLDGPAAAVSLAASAMLLVGAFAAARGIDPGRPRVAEFGRRLYSMRMDRRAAGGALAAPVSEALRKKFGSAHPGDPRARERAVALRRFLGALSRQRFASVVFDYDGTLYDRVRGEAGPSQRTRRMLSRLLAAGVTVGVATGRGNSVHESLSEAIPGRLHAGVVVGYHNGAETARLNRPPPKQAGPPPGGLVRCLAKLASGGLIPAGTTVSKRRGQISLRSDTIRAAPLLRGLGGVDGAAAGGIRIVESGHSVDLLAPGTSKMNLYREVRRLTPPGFEVLCIGDSGGAPGNDSELLGTRYSLTVDDASGDPSTCWNLLPRGVSGEAGTAEYVGRFSVKDGHLRTRMNKWV